MHTTRKHSTKPERLFGSPLPLIPQSQPQSRPRETKSGRSSRGFYHGPWLEFRLYELIEEKLNKREKVREKRKTAEIGSQSERWKLVKTFDRGLVKKGP